MIIILVDCTVGRRRMTDRLHQCLLSICKVKLIRSYNEARECLRRYTPVIKMVVFSGSSASVLDASIRRIFRPIAKLFLDSRPVVPILGVCFGMQLIACAHGGEVKHNQHGLVDSCASISGIDQYVRFIHLDHVHKLPVGFERVASSHHLVHAAMKHAFLPWWGLQFHPEADYDASGILRTIISNPLGENSSGKVQIIQPPSKIVPKQSLAQTVKRHVTNERYT